jgi:CO dehydrogenase maturation factor
MVCGKGGAGKSAITILIARAINERGRVYILDSDESNRLLSGLLGASKPSTIAEYLGGRKNLSKGLQEIDSFKLGKMPPKYVSYSPERIGMAIVGKIEEYGEGCACPYGLLSKVLLKKLELDDNTTVIVDTEAGVEHLGRGVEEGIDLLIGVVDPTAEGVAIAGLLGKETERIGKPFHVILNKVTPEVAPVMDAKLRENGLSASAVIGVDPEIFDSGLRGGRLRAGEAQRQVSEYVRSYL